MGAAMTLAEAHFYYIMGYGKAQDVAEGVTEAMVTRYLRALMRGDYADVVNASRRCVHPPHGRREQHRYHSHYHFHWNGNVPNADIAALMAVWSKT